MQAHPTLYIHISHLKQRWFQITQALYRPIPLTMITHRGYPLLHSPLHYHLHFHDAEVSDHPDALFHICMNIRVIYSSEITNR